MQNLQRKLEEMDHKSYPAYKALTGNYHFSFYTLFIDHVQGDPFASPSRIHVEISGKKAGFPAEYYENRYRRVALEDALLRGFSKALAKQNAKKGYSGSGKSGLLAISRFGQEILERSAVHVDPKTGDVSFYLAAGFPADGRRIRAQELKRMLFDVLPCCVKEAGIYANLNQQTLQKVIDLADDQQAIRVALKELDLVAFVADGSILPRESGTSERPMIGAVPFQSPESMRVTLQLPHKGSMTGMGIKKGVTLIVGGGYHGKSTVLKALEKGVYPHIAGDGREYVITDADAVKIRAEDGRSIYKTDISLFIQNLPNKKDTVQFITADASGSTSQAANVVEAMEAGATVLLMDEDTSATNFMIRDELMARVVADGKEPIIPFIRRVRSLYEKSGISTILVAGSCGAFFYVADTIIQMDNYYPKEITAQAKKMAQEFPMDCPKEAVWQKPQFTNRFTAKKQLQRRSATDHGRRGGHGQDRRKIKLQGRDGFFIDKKNVDLRYLEQITDEEQLLTIARLLDYMERELFSQNLSLPNMADKCLEKLQKEGFAFLGGGKILSDMAMPRKAEICGCINRYYQLADNF
ncbi:MAG: ABC-ATPase domain-containing protein [Lachnospiraceae bacterium]